MLKNNHPDFKDANQELINLFNKTLGNIELTPEENQSLLFLCTREKSTIKNLISAIEKSKKLK